MSYVIHTTGNGAKGDTGRVGKTGGRGVKGNKGDDGKSAYEIWLDCGNTGTEQDFLDSLRGADGNDGINASIGTSITISNIYFTTSNTTTTIPFGCGNNGLVCGGNFTVNGFLQVSSHTMSHTHNLAGVAAYAEDGTLVTFPTFPSGTQLSNLNGLWGLNESGAFVTNRGNVGHMVYWGTSYTLSNCSALTFNNIGASDEYIGFTKMSGEIIGAISMTASDIYASTIYTETLYATQSIAYSGSNSSALFTYPNIATSYLMTQRIGEVREGGTIIEPTPNDFATRGSVSNYGYNISLFGNEIKIGTPYTEVLAKRDDGSQAFLASYSIAQSTSVGIFGDIIDIGQDQMYTIYGTNNGFAYRYADRTYRLSSPYYDFGSRPYSLIYTERHRTSEINILASCVNIGTEPYRSHPASFFGDGIVERTDVNIFGLLNLLHHTANISVYTGNYINSNNTPIGDKITANFSISYCSTKREIVEDTTTITVYDDPDPDNNGGARSLSFSALKYTNYPGYYLGIHLKYINNSQSYSKFYPLFSIGNLAINSSAITIRRPITLSVVQLKVVQNQFPLPTTLSEIQNGCYINVTERSTNNFVINIDANNNTSSAQTYEDSFDIRIKPNSSLDFKSIGINGTVYQSSQMLSDNNGWYYLTDVNINRNTTIQVLFE